MWETIGMYEEPYAFQHNYTLKESFCALVSIIMILRPIFIRVEMTDISRKKLQRNDMQS